MSTTITYPSGVTGPVPPLPVRKFTVDEYHQLIASGTLKSGDPYELLEGWIVAKMSRNAPHDVTLDLLNGLLRDALPRDLRVRVQSAVTLDESEPEPDIAVVQGPAQRYMIDHPTPADIRLIVEISESSLQHDRTTKVRIYARAGIPTFWIVNLVDRQIEVCSQPTGEESRPEYHQRTDFQAGQSVPVAIDGVIVASIAVDDVLP